MVSAAFLKGEAEGVMAFWHKIDIKNFFCRNRRLCAFLKFQPIFSKRRGGGRGGGVGGGQCFFKKNFPKMHNWNLGT